MLYFVGNLVISDDRVLNWGAQGVKMWLWFKSGELNQNVNGKEANEQKLGGTFYVSGTVLGPGDVNHSASLKGVKILIKYKEWLLTSGKKAGWIDMDRCPSYLKTHRNYE